MRFCLVSAASSTSRWDREGRDPKHEPVSLGVIAVAGCLLSLGITPSFVDLDRAFRSWMQRGRKEREHATFEEEVLARLAAEDADVFGFGSICSSYPTTLRLATRLKRLRPDAWVMLGGPQASMTAVETLSAFDAVDVVVRGEAESVLPAFVEANRPGTPLVAVPGTACRCRGEIIRSPDPDPPADLDALPFPAYHLYTDLKGRRSLPIELGRGCPFACTFCSTSQFFRRRHRIRSPERVAEIMHRLREQYDVSYFDLIHDNFAADRTRASAFCEALAASPTKMTWGCSARTDCVDRHLVRLMLRAGCRGVFFGVECGSRRLQRAIGKGLDPREAFRTVRCANRAGLDCAVAFITGFPEETPEDHRATISYFFDALRLDRAEPQLSILSPLPGTKIYRDNAANLVFDEVISDMVFQGLALDESDRQLVKAHPRVFSAFYAAPTTLDRRRLEELRLFLVYAQYYYRWLLLAAHEACGHILDVFDDWLRWSRPRRRGPNARGPAYHAGPGFWGDWLAFVRTVIVRRQPGCAVALRTLCSLHAALGRPRRGRAARGDRRVAPRGPILARGVRIVRLKGDYQEIIHRLRARRSLAGLKSTSCSVAARWNVENGRFEVIQLSSESAKLLGVCDGTRSLPSVLRVYGRRSSLAVRSREAAGLVGLRLLERQKLVSHVEGGERPGAASGPRRTVRRDRRPGSGAGDAGATEREARVPPSLRPDPR